MMLTDQAQLLLDDDEHSIDSFWLGELGRDAVDELFFNARRHRTGADFQNLIRFIARFRWYSPFNSLLIQLQMPGATYVAGQRRWRQWYGRSIKPGARPMVILRPAGPVMFVFDVSQTVAEEGAPELPQEVTSPFEVCSGRLPRHVFEHTTENAVRDGVAVLDVEAGSQLAGYIRRVIPGRVMRFQTAYRPRPRWVTVPRLFEVHLNASHAPETRYATLIHELAHLYCGHLGSPNPLWWRDRTDVSNDLRELEAETVSYLVCARLGIEVPSERYLSAHLDEGDSFPDISVDSVLKAAGLIERMGRERLKPRKRQPVPHWL